MKHNIYMPGMATIKNIKEEVKGARAIKTFHVIPDQGKARQKGVFPFECGQCAMLSVFGKGESMISISSSPLNKEYLQFSILKTGRVTTALHDLKAGDQIGLRGPYGNSFPIGKWKGKNLLFIAGGIGIAPVWSVLQTALKKSDYGDLSLFYGARTSSDLVYRDELSSMKNSKKGVKIHLSVDSPEKGWDDYVGFVPANVLDRKPSPKNTIAITCGPPIMIRFVIENLQKLGFRDNQIFTTVENKMKCGIGKCGRCNIGSHYVCKDGPVYSWEELKKLPQDY